ncbi:MAG TPA: response regulator transcription factor [Gaiellaceae bacterium]|nr:response regulator transcription factor [Gaiellaceae bacterium]
MRRLKVVVADDHGLMVEAVRIALAGRADMEVVGVAEAGSQVLPVVQQTQPDLVVLDLRMPGMDGLTCIPLLRERFPDLRIAILSGLDSGDAVEEAMRLGASAFISKRVDPAELPDALLAAMSGEPVRGLIGSVDQPRGAAVRDAGLTERELEILRALGAGRSNREIAKMLWLAEQTVKFHLTNIYRKLNVSSRTEAVHWAYQHNLLSVGGDGDDELLRRSASGAH